MDDQRYMRLALEICRAGVEQGQSPFGACIVDAQGQVLACEHNHVWQATDPSAHAEICAIRTACQTLGQVHLPGATLYSTTEPCAMCFSAIHWTRIDRIVFAATVADAASFGFNELPITNAVMKQVGQAEHLELVEQFMRDEAIELYQLWQAGKGRAY